MPPPNVLHKVDATHFGAIDAEVLSQGDVLSALPIAMLSIELSWLTGSEAGYHSSATAPAEGEGLLMAEGRLLPAIVLSFTCDILKTLRRFVDANGEFYETSAVVHVAPILPLPDGAGNIRAGKQFNALYMPARGERGDSYIDFSLYQPMSIRTILAAVAQRTEALTEAGRVRLAVAFAQYLGDDARRKQTSSIATPEERQFLANAVQILHGTL